MNTSNEKNDKTTPRKSSVARSLLEIVGAVAIGVVVLAAIEGVASGLLFVNEVRNASPPDKFVRPGAAPDAALGWRNAGSVSRADAFGQGIGLHTTAQGYRLTGKPAGDSAQHLHHVVCLGDSYTYGFGVDDAGTWCWRLQHDISNVQTANIAQDNYGIDQLYLLYKGLSSVPEHDVLVFAITNNELERATSAENNGWPKPTVSLNGKQIEVHNNPVPVLTASSYRRYQATRSFSDLRVMQAVQRMDAFNPGLKRARAVDDSRPVFEALLSDMRAKAESQHAKLLLVYLPNMSDFKPSAMLDARRAWLAQYASAQQIAFADLTPKLRTLRGDSLDISFYSRSSTDVPSGARGQYTNLGHTWVAHEIATALIPLLSQSAPVTAPAPGRK